MKNQTRKNANQNRTSFTTKRIDINSIERQLTAALTERARLQKRQDDLWAEIDRHKCDRSASMHRINQGIGANTHKLNKLIDELCQYKKTHRAMNMAYNYLAKEIQRIERIIASNERAIRDVNAGRKYLINSTGRVHYDTTSLEKYVKLKKEQANKLRKWKSAVGRYVA